MGCLKSRDTYVNPCVKYFMFFYNFFLWLAGGTFFGIGLYAYIDKAKFSDVTINSVADVFFDLSILCIIIGIVVFLIATAGCIGALRENIILLRIYYICIIIIFLLEVGAIVFIFVFRDVVQKNITDILEENLITKYHNNPDLGKVIDFFQENYECCGVGEDGYLDWNKNLYFNCSGFVPGVTRTMGLMCDVPASCCKKVDTVEVGVTNLFCGGDILVQPAPTETLDRVYTVGCVGVLLSEAEDNLPILGGIILGITIPQLLGICLGRTLEGQILDQRKRWLSTRR